MTTGQSEKQRDGQGDSPVYADPVHQLEEAEKQRQTQSQINQMESNPGMRGKQVEHRAQKKVASRGLLL